MPLFSYIATEGRDAADVRGTIAAETPRQARDLLRRRGLIVRDLTDAPLASAAGRSPQTATTGKARKSGSRRRTGRGVRGQVTGFVRELSTLLDVGVPLHEALATLAAQATGRFRQVVLSLRERVAEGASLAAAMREQPGVFDELSCSLVAVGEDAGALEASLDRLAGFRERSDQLRGRIGTALLYPAVVLVMAVFASTFLMTFVVPRILEPLIEQGQPLPWPTLVVKAISDFLVAWGWLLAVLGAVGLGGFFAWRRTERGRRRMDGLLLSLPLFGPVVRKQGIVRMAIVLSTLLKGGVQFLVALQVARRTVGNAVLADALLRCERAVAAGGDIADALDTTRAFPPAVVQVFAVGQQAGRLEEVLDRLATAYDQQVSAASQRLAALLEPVLIILLAGLVLFIILATVLPILEAGNAIG